MIENFSIKLILTIIFFLCETENTTDIHIKYVFPLEEYILLYDNCEASIYNPNESQCDKTPNITGDGSIINSDSASNYRWIAISHDLLLDSMRAKLINDSSDVRFKGKISYGDTVWIESPTKAINGWWVVHDAMNPNVRNTIDFLQTKNDKSLFDKHWPGKFKNIKISTLKYGNYKSSNK